MPQPTRVRLYFRNINIFSFWAVFCYAFLFSHHILYTLIVNTTDTVARCVGRIAFRVHVMASVVNDWAPMVGLIFGGCCSNVFALETIIKAEPSSGLLVTFVQFVVVAVFTWPTQFSSKHPPLFFKPLAVPLQRWIPNIIMFFSVNLLNNMAFGYNISVPVHIILRSGGSVLTMIVGYIWGRRYTVRQVLSVFMLTIGIIIAAMADARAKGKLSSTDAKMKFDPEVLAGLAILFIAQLISAIMGLYVQLTYAKYGSHWLENLFYSHLLSIPLFLPFHTALIDQFKTLSSGPPLILSPSIPQLQNTTGIQPNTIWLGPILSTPSFPVIKVPPHLLSLALNALTQYACIRGVNLLAARTSALGVTIVLNIRKLVSLFISILVFGNQLPGGVTVGAAIVFGSAAVWAWESQRIGREKAAEEKERKKE